MKNNSRILITGSEGLLGSALKKNLENNNFINLFCPSSKELDLRDQSKVCDYFNGCMPEYVFNCAAKVGGIKANMEFPASFIYDNIMIQSNIIYCSWKYGVKKMIFYGSNCMYPREAKQPLKEEYFLQGEPEPTNKHFAVAKISGICMCQAYNQQYSTNFVTVVPASLYGPNDDFFSENSHLVPALLRRFHEAKIKKFKKVTLWGSGNPRRELMYVDDIVNASLFIIDNYNSSDIINVGVGNDYTVKEIANIAAYDVVDYKGKILFDNTGPDGIIQKLLDVKKINSLGWKSKITLFEGISKTYTSLLSINNKMG